MLIIPAIDILDGRVVRLTRGRREAVKVYSEDPVAVALRWQEEGARRLHLVDLGGAFSGRPNLDILKAIAEAVSIPIQFGGGLRSLKAIEECLSSGAVFAITGTIALKDESLLEEACRLYPGRVIASIDAYRGRVAVKGWQEVSGASAIALAGGLERLPLAGIIYTDVARDGSLRGPNLRAIGEMARAAKHPLIAAGGIASLRDVLRLREIQGLYGIILGKALYEGTISLKQALKLSGIDVSPLP